MWENARFILADFPLDRKEIPKILPGFMRAGPDLKATLFIVDHTQTSFTVPYREAPVLIHVRTSLEKGPHCPWMLMDDDTALIHGREILDTWSPSPGAGRSRAPSP